MFDIEKNQISPVSARPWGRVEAGLSPAGAETQRAQKIWLEMMFRPKIFPSLLYIIHQFSGSALKPTQGHHILETSLSWDDERTRKCTTSICLIFTIDNSNFSCYTCTHKIFFRFLAMLSILLFQPNTRAFPSESPNCHSKVSLEQYPIQFNLFSYHSKLAPFDIGKTRCESNKLNED